MIMFRLDKLIVGKPSRRCRVLSGIGGKALKTIRLGSHIVAASPFQNFLKETVRETGRHEGACLL